jgi:hypothetical protein
MAGLIGTTSADTIVGSSSPDSIDALGGDDLIVGYGDGSGVGGTLPPGDPGGGGPLDDDALVDGLGNDTSWGGGGDDTIRAGEGNDLLRGGDGRDVLRGGHGSDTVLGDRGADRLFGADGRDILRGGLGDDRLNGGDGNDRVFGGGGFDALFGGDGHDVLHGGGGDDSFNGGDGTDVATFAGNIADYQITTVAGVTTVVDAAPLASGDDGTDTLTKVEQLRFADGIVSLTSPLAVLDLSVLSPPRGFVIHGEESSGYSVASAGDVNADGIGDLIIGAPEAGPNGEDSGESYVIFGRVGGFAGSLDLSALDGTDGFALRGIAEDDYSGQAVAAAGDVNADSIDDLIIGAAGADPNGRWSGESYVVYGRSVPFAPTLELSALDGTDGFTIRGIEFKDYSGMSVASAGDVNADGVDDLIIGARGGDSNAQMCGESYVVFGSTDGFDPDLVLSSLDGTNGFVINGEGYYRGLSGFSVASAGDVNADGIGDLMVGAPSHAATGGTTPNPGYAYVVFGKSDTFAPTLELSDLDGSNGFTLEGVDGNDRCGRSIASAGDVNADGIDDLIIGAGRADPNGESSGESYVVFGKAGTFAPNLELSSLDGTNGFTITGIDAEDWSGFSVASAGDINSDGIDDLIIGARNADPNGESSGEAYLVFGTTEGFGPTLELSSLDGTNGLKIEGIGASDMAGRSVAYAGDVNADGTDDVIIGAPHAGESYVLYGGSFTTDDFLM